MDMISIHVFLASYRVYLFVVSYIVYKYVKSKLKSLNVPKLIPNVIWDSYVEIVTSEKGEGGYFTIYGNSLSTDISSVHDDASSAVNEFASTIVERAKFRVNENRYELNK